MSAGQRTDLLAVQAAITAGAAKLAEPLSAEQLFNLIAQTLYALRAAHEHEADGELAAFTCQRCRNEWVEELPPLENDLSWPFCHQCDAGRRSMTDAPLLLYVLGMEGA